ncbi:MAG: S8 family serine peptidase, partial [Sciscionella sp.]
MRHTRNALRIAASVLAVAGMAGPAFPVFGAPPPTTSAAPPPLKQVISVPVPASRLPPPVNPTNKPKSTAPSPAPLVFAKQKGCIQSSVGAVQLKNMPWPQQTLQIAKAHQFATGAGQTVAVIDTGVHRHSQFQNRLVGGGDYVLPGGNGLEDCDGHGTEVAGIIGAKTAPDTGFDGMAPGADIVSIRQTSANYMTENKGPNGQGQRAGTLGTLAKAVMWAANFAKAPNGKPVSVINISLAACHTVSEGLDPSYRALQAAIHYAVHRRNIVVVAAAGNL